MQKNNKIDESRKIDGAQIDGVIWDLDNTLYRFEGDFEHACHIAAAKAAVKAGLDFDYDQALELCFQSYETYGHSYMIFIKEYGVEHKKIHFDFHTFIDEKLIRGEMELIALFERAPLDHVLVTHASREWAARALDHIGLRKFFPDERIIPAEEVDFERKSSSRVPFEKALGLLGLEASRVIVVEDIAENLQVPRSMGLDTVLVHYGQPPLPMPDYVGHDYNNAIDFLIDVID